MLQAQTPTMKTITCKAHVRTKRARKLAQTCTSMVWAQVAVQKASLEQNTKVAETLRDELNKGKDLADVKKLANMMKEELAKKLGSHKQPAQKGEGEASA